MKKLVLMISLMLTLSIPAIAGCRLMIQNTDVDPNHPDCVKHMDTYNCDGSWFVVTWYDCY